MTTFLKVGSLCWRDVGGADVGLVYDVWPAVEGELSDTFAGKERLEDSFSASVRAGDGGGTNGDLRASSQYIYLLSDRVRCRD